MAGKCGGLGALWRNATDGMKPQLASEGQGSQLISALGIIFRNTAHGINQLNGWRHISGMANMLAASCP